MGEKRNFAALDWVMGEISDTLREARQSLEAFVEDPKDTTRIRFCLTHIHQVHGSLQMVEFHGAALLAEEMEQTAQAIMENTVSSVPEAQEVLMRGLLQLPIFLEHVKAVKDDNPARILPLLNDMRAVRKQSYLSETNLFSPDFSTLDKIVGEKHAVLSQPQKLQEVLKKLREMYQYAAASVLRGVKVDENLGYIEKVFARLDIMAKGTPSYPVWEVSSALIEALKSDDLELTVAVRGLLRYIAREMRILSEKAPKAFDVKPREPLLKNLLFYVSRAEENENNKRVIAVVEKYNLRNALIGEKRGGSSSDGMLQAPDADAVRSVVVALQDEIGNIKHILDLSLSGQISVKDFKEVLPSVKRVSDTLAVLGIGDLRKHMLEQSEQLEKISEGDSIDEQALMQAAGKIIEIEHRLQAISKSVGKSTDLANVDEREVEIDNAKATVVQQSISGLHHCKESIIDYISSQWDKQHLESVESTLKEIRGGLQMIPLRRPAAIVESCARFIQDKLVDGAEHPDFKTLESLADAMASVEYYLERLVEDLYEDSDSMLDIAEESVEGLGYPIELTSAPDDAPATPPVSDYVDVEETSVDELPEEVVEENVEAIAEAIDVPAEEVAAELDAVSHEPEAVEESTASEPEPISEPEPVQEPEPAPEPEPVAEAEDEEEIESDIDEEIIEIFIEEAGEVLETLGEYYPLWKENQNDQDSLVVVRRAFHTLKGSGRMVEAFDIGELAWSVENMLNRVIDRTIQLQPHVFNLIDAVIELAPTLIKAFEARKKNPKKALTEKYEAWGHNISEGNFPDELANPVTGALDAAPEPSAEPEAPEAVEPAPAEEAAVEEVEFVAPEAQDEQEEDNDFDPVLQEIFSQESQTHLMTLDKFIGDMESHAPIYSVPTDDLQRALHTLKGSAKMAQVWPIAEITEPLELFAKELITFQVPVDDDILQLLRDAASYARTGIEQIDAGKQVQIDQLEMFLARTQELRDNAVGHLILPKDEDTGISKVDPRMLSLVMAEEMALLLEVERLLNTWQKTGNPGDDHEKLINELTALQKGAEQANLLGMASLCKLLHDANLNAVNGRLRLDDEFFRLLHCGHENLLDMVDAVAAGQNVVTPDATLIKGLGQILADQQPVAEPEEDDVHEESAEQEGASFETGSPYDEFFDEAIEAATQSNDSEDDSTVEPEAEVSDFVLPESEETEEISFDVGESEVSDDVAGEETSEDDITFDFSESEGANEAFVVEADSPEEFVVTDEASEETEISFEVDTSEESDSDVEIHFEAEEPSNEADEDESLELQSVEFSVDESSEEAEEEIEISVDASDDESFEQESPQVENSAPMFASEDHAFGESHGETASLVYERPAEFTSEDNIVPGLIDRIDSASEDFDRDILEVFMEEAEELVEGLDESIHAWESNYEDKSAIEEIERILHTLKGGARLSGLSTLGDVVHDYETMLIEKGHKIENLNPGFFAKIHRYQDLILGSAKGVRAFLDGNLDVGEVDPEAFEGGSASDHSAASSPEAKESASTEGTPKEGAPTEAAQEKESSNVVNFAPKPIELPTRDLSQDDSGFSMPAVGGGGGGGGAQAAPNIVAKKAGPQEVVKVNSELLEELVNLAGETSINRSRLEQFVNDFSFSLDEIDTTLTRLQDQLRRLDIETEAQILFRQEQMEQLDDFDPLEMDRYSNLQQLSRSLIESSSDLMDLKSDLGDKLRSQETLLLQQSRINTTMQEGLMRSRMVPFSRLVPRLRRIVRQVAGELGKNVNFELDNVEGELDRSVLERMVPPFEHMLRNAVDHGIESPEDREAAGKPETGRIVLSLSREGGDVIIRLADDGRGVNLQRVREKAIERELMAPDADLSDHDIMQFILHAGFSTAEAVTQISGRGVGMDVVHAEIKALGGSVTINSAWGKGTEFVVRLPFTLSVNRALMVAIGQDSYAVPLSSIEGIVRVSPFELEHYYANPEAKFEYANENYDVRYLGALLHTGAKPVLEGHVLPLPVILVRSAEHTMALQVDAVMGSREIVVKSLGLQFSAVAGLSGATVMGDGSVVVILDPHALVRQEIARATLQLEHDGLDHLHQEDDRIKTIMVVDDSVTVRKVTTRFLEREGFEVITAKDGMDAIRVLQEQIPDLMLLDIEMPRMDGFEVAKTVRGTQRWEHVPIIMITSRTGDKHRDHALSLGVNNYLGKPYQEDILLEAISEILENKTAHA